MKTLTNNVADCQLLNLETGHNRRGPYVLRQDAVAPGSMQVKTHRFFLRSDGTWVNSLAVYVLPEAEQQAQFTFETIAEVYALLNTLAGRVRADAALPEGKSAEELIEAAKASTSRVWAGIQRARGSKLA